MDLGYAWKDIWVDGFCLGGAVAIHLKKKYHEKGINLFIQNTFDTMLGVFQQQMFPVGFLSKIGLGELGLKEIRSPNPTISSKTTQDPFDSISKLNSLKGKEKKGTSIVINTDTDTIVGPRSHDRLTTALEEISEKAFHGMYSPPEKEKKKNGHSLDVLSNNDLWNMTVTWITSKDYPEILTASAG